MKSLTIESAGLDAVDVRIIDCLAKNARISVAELARAVRLSAPSVAERIRRLEDRHVIAGYAARIEPAAIGYPIAAWLRIRPVPGELARVTEIIKGIPEITQCDRVTGEDCFVARVNVTAVLDLERIIDLIIPYAMTNTAIVQSSPVPARMSPIRVST